MNRRAQSVFTLIFWGGTFIILWALALSGWLSTFGHQAVVNNNLTGIEAWAYDNLNLVVFAVFTVSLFFYGYITGGSQ